MYQERLDALGSGGKDTRPYREYSQPTVEKFQDRYYLFTPDVFDLSDGGKKLSPSEVDKLPVRVTYTGEEFEYRADTKEAFEILMRIISNGNKMQDRESYSVMLGMHCRNIFLFFIMDGLLSDQSHIFDFQVSELQ